MKKKNFSGLKAFFVSPVLLIIATITMSGCSFFTNSWGKSFSRDMTDVYSKQSLDKLLELANDPSLQNDKEASKQLLAAIGGKDVKSLSAEEKNTVLKLTISTSINAHTLATTLDNIQNATSGSASSDTVDAIVNGILDSFEPTDISAFATLMGDSASVSAMDPVLICISTICAATQIAKENNLVDADGVRDALVDVADHGNTGNTVHDAAEAIAGSGNTENISTLETIFEGFKDINFDAEIISGSTLREMFPNP